MVTLIVTQEQLKKAVMQVVYSDRKLCPSQQVYGISVAIWKQLNNDSEKFKMHGLGEGYGNCSECAWHNEPQGCNVAKDSPACNLNRKLKIEKDSRDM